MALCRRLVVICNKRACEPLVGHVPGGLDGDTVPFCEGEERFGCVFRYEEQVDVFLSEGPLVSATEQEQSLGKFDRSGIDGVEAFDELAGMAVWIVAGDLKKGLRDRQWGTSSWKAFAANLCCSATCASSRASMASKLSASSRNSSLRPFRRILGERSVSTIRVASVMRVKGASICRREPTLPRNRTPAGRPALRLPLERRHVPSRSGWLRTEGE